MIIKLTSILLLTTALGCSNENNETRSSQNSIIAAESTISNVEIDPYKTFEYCATRKLHTVSNAFDVNSALETLEDVISLGKWRNPPQEHFTDIFPVIDEAMQQNWKVGPPPPISVEGNQYKGSWRGTDVAMNTATNNLEYISKTVEDETTTSGNIWTADGKFTYTQMGFPKLCDGQDKEVICKNYPHACINENINTSTL